MCLVALAWKSHPHWQLLLAGNRDEFHARPTAALARWPGEPAILAGRDLQSGGTWAGIDGRGRCAVVTNVRDPLAAMPAPVSRGALPVDFLQDAADADCHGRRLLADPIHYAPYNLLLVDADSCEYVGNYPVEHRTIAPGIHGMSNGGFDSDWPKTRRLCAAMQAWSRTDATDPTTIWEALADEHIAADHDLPDTGVGLELERMLSATFIRGPQYGTRASTLIAIDYQGRGWISERSFDPDGVFQGETTLYINIQPDPIKPVIGSNA